MKALLTGGALCLLTCGVVWVSAAVIPQAPETPTSIGTSTLKPVDLKNSSSTTNKPINESLPNNGGTELRSEKASNSPAIGESIQMVANQLLQGNKTPPPATGTGGMVIDVRTPPKMKTQQSNKNKIAKPTIEPDTAKIENSHAGIAIPMNPDDIEKTVSQGENVVKTNNKVTSTLDEGLSTWILLSGSPTTPASKLDQTKKESSSTTSKEKTESTTEMDIKKTSQNNKDKINAPTKPTRSPSIITMKPAFVRKPVAIGSSNKSDLIASGSAVNENTMNKIKASVLASIQKNKNAALSNKTTIGPAKDQPAINAQSIQSTQTSTTSRPTTAYKTSSVPQSTITQKPATAKPASTTPKATIIRATSTAKPVTASKLTPPSKTTPTTKPSSTTKKIKVNKTSTTEAPIASPSTKKVKINKVSTTLAPISNVKTDEKVFTKLPEIKVEVVKVQKPVSTGLLQNSDLGMESKHAEVEIEVSTPASSTKKPKRTSNKRKKNKNKNRQRKPSSTTVKPDETMIESKIQSNLSKTPPKVVQKEKPITTQIYNYLSREVMPSVGVGLMSLAGIVGLASYLFYPFGGVVRRAYNVNDRKDDLYHQNGEQYADDGGQREEEILGSLFPDNSVETHNKIQSVNPYSGQPQFQYPQTKPPQEQNIRYRNVAYSSDANSFVSKDRVGQRNPDGIHGSAYSENIQYDTHSNDNNDRYSQYLPQPVYQSPDRQTENPGYLSDPVVDTYNHNSHNRDPEPNVYEYGQAMRFSQEIMTEPTNGPIQETLHLGAEDVIEQQKESGYTVDSMGLDDAKQPQFVVGNIPKELIEAVTPVSVPEHGPRSLRRKRSNSEVIIQEYGIQSAADSLKEILRAAHNEDLYVEKDKYYQNQYFEPERIPQNDFYTKIQAKSKINSKKFYPMDKINVEVKKMKYSNRKFKRDTSDIEEVFDSNKQMRVLQQSKDDDFENSISGSSDDQIPTIIYAVNKFDANSPNTHEKYNEYKVANETKKSAIEFTDFNQTNETTTSKTVFIDLKETEDKTTTLENFIDLNQDKDRSTTLKSTFIDLNQDKDRSTTLKSTFIDLNQDKDRSTTLKSTFNDLNQEPDLLINKTSDTNQVVQDVETTSPTLVQTFPNNGEPTPQTPEKFSFINFIRGLIDFKLRLGIGLLQTTSKTVSRFFQDFERSINGNLTASQPQHMRRYQKH